MPSDDDKFITLPKVGLVTGAEAEDYLREEAIVVATRRRRAADDFLQGLGFRPPAATGSEPLDRLAALLDSEELDMLDESGSLLISSEATLRDGGNSDIYFLGLNPGGEAGEDFSIFGRFPTIYESLALSRMGVSGWDQDWSRKDASYPPGQAPMQRRFKHIAGFLGLAYGEIFATNLVFARSRRFKALRRLEEQIEACLPVHQLLVEIVQPKRLWVMGNTDSAGNALNLHGDVRWRDAKHANWSIGHGTVDFCGRRMTLCHTPHLSLWDATSEDKQELLDFAFHGH